MAKTTTTPFTQNIKNIGCILSNAGGVAPVPNLLAYNATTGQPTNANQLVTFYTAGAEGAVLKSMSVSNNQAVAKILGVWVQPSGTGNYYLLGQINVPASAGTGSGTTVSVDLLGNTVLIGLSYDQMGKPILPLAGGSVVAISCTTALATDQLIYVTGTAEEF